MAAKRKPTKRRKPRSAARKKKTGAGGPAFTLLGLAAFVIFIFYLGAKVQVEEVLRETSELTEEKLYLDLKVNDLNLEINALKSYERISRLAKRQGLVPLESRDLKQLKVNFDGLSFFTINPRLGLSHAGMQPVWPR